MASCAWRFRFGIEEKSVPIVQNVQVVFGDFAFLSLGIKRKEMRFKTVCTIVLLLSSIIGADVRSFAQTTNVRVAFNGFGGIAPIYLGQDAGIFKKQGLNLEMIFRSLSLQ